ncbi:MAG: glycoside hydrolase family 2 TIM barrel-domain containing protein [Bacteroidota bacterium]|nr:glycoside hydrolase family 2 TIM barrel-domain containing protein [Bacteroidota bacterium]
MKFKLIILTCLFVVFAHTSSAQLSFGDPVKINTNWQFHLGDCDALKADPSISWRTLNLPHDWSIEGELSPSLASCTGYLPGGTGWYKKEMEIPVNKAGKKVYLYFEGIYNHSEVYINGHLLGKRPNGYVSFAYDATPFIRFGSKNTIIVRVDHSKSADSRWYTGSGIYRNVWLIYANPVHFAQWGITCETKKSDTKEALLKIKSAIENSSRSIANLMLNIRLINKEGKAVADKSEKIVIAPKNHKTDTIDLKIESPDLWNLDRPYLYTLEVSIKEGNKIIDQTTIPVGIRNFIFNPNKGFALNDKWMKLKGVCIHHDAGVLGAAVPKEVWERRLTTLKQMGCNAIRLSHNPQAPELYDLCDKLGFLVMDEAFDEWESPKRKWLTGWNNGTPGYEGSYEFFNEWSERDLQDMICRDRNHPSIFAWSIGNEVDYPNDPYTHPILNGATINQPMYGGYMPNHPAAERLGSIAKRLASIVKKYDTSRPVTAALAGVVMSNETEYPAALDIAGYNYTENRYAQDHQKYPNRVIFGSENGQGLNEWKSVRDNDYIFGQFLWSGIDYLGEAGTWPSRGLGTGLLDFSGFMKPWAYFRQSLWSSAPMIYIGTQRISKSKEARDPWHVWNYPTGDSVRVVCFTNTAKAQLLLNGKTIGNKQVYNDQTGTITWNIAYQDGKLEAVGYDKSDNPVCRDSIITAQAPYAIIAKANTNCLNVDQNLAQIEVLVVDKNGNPVTLAENEITCKISGNVEYLGMEAGNNRDVTNYKSSTRKVFHGRLLCYIESQNKKGKALIQFTSPGLLSAKSELEIR